MSRTPEKTERGPVETVESKGVKVPIYYSPYRDTESYLLAYYSDCKRKRERAPSLPAARKRAKELIESLSKGVAHVATFTAKDAAAINTAVDILTPLDIPLTEAARQIATANEILGGFGTIEEAARFLVAERQRHQIPRKLFGEVVSDFLDEIKPPARSYRHWQDCSARLGLAAERFKTVPIMDVRTIDLENHLNKIQRRVRTKQGMKTLSGPGQKATGRNRNNYRGVFCNLFSYAQRLGYLPRNIETEAEHLREAPDRDANVAIYQPDAMQTIMDALPDKWIPFAAIGAFAGCRGAEIHRLDWSDIDLEERHITVESSKSKTGKRRVVPISDTLYAFLAPYALCRMNMFLHGMDNFRIEWGDTLRNPRLIEGDQLMKFDIVVANMPFSLDKWGQEDAGKDPFQRFHRGLPPKSKGDWAFISHLIETAREGTGKVGVVVPHGVLFRGAAEGKIRQRMIEENLLEAVIGLPSNLFFGTGIPAAILLFNKGRTTGDVLFIDASREYKEAKNQNVLTDEHVGKIVDTYRAFQTVEKYAYRATPQEIADNDFNLNIPRYVDTFEEEAEIDLDAVQSEISRLESELATVRAKMAEHLDDLGI